MSRTQRAETGTKLAPSCIRPSHFDKMKVSNALNLFSHSIGAGLRYLVESEGHNKAYLTTAWFLEQCNHWFNLMSSRHPVMALSKSHHEKYIEALAFLESFIEILTSVQIGKKAEWKPIQTGVIASTTSVLEIQEELLDNGHKFLQTSRLTQDCLENLFRSV